MAAITGKNLDSKLLPEPVHFMKYFLPDEIWCHIFSYLDDKSLRNVSVICKLWLGIIRGSEQLSGTVILKSIGLSELQARIATSQWIWERWPSMKTLKIPLKCFLPSTANPRILDMIKSIKFEQCQKLERVVLLNTNCLWTNFGILRELCFDPRDIPFNWSLGHVPFLHISKNVDLEALEEFVEKTKTIQSLSIEVGSNGFEDAILTNGFNPLFRIVSERLESFYIEVGNNYGIHENAKISEVALLTALGQNCPNLRNLLIKHYLPFKEKVDFGRGYHLKNSFSKVEQLHIPKLKYISVLINNSNNLKKLFVECVTLREFYNFDFQNLFRMLHELEKFYICIKIPLKKMKGQHDLKAIIDHSFPKKTEVIVVYNLPGNKYAVLTKLPFQTTQYDQNLTPKLKKTLPWSSTKKYSRSAMTECMNCMN